MEELNKYFLNNNRRHFLKNIGFGIGGLALGSMLDPFNLSDSNGMSKLHSGSLPLPHFAPKAKRVIYLFQSGGPSQLDLFDYKPKLNQSNKKVYHVHFTQEDKSLAPSSVTCL